MCLKAFYIYAPLLAASLALPACKPRGGNSIMQNSELGDPRNQLFNGTCWIYGMAGALNGTILRANVRLMMAEMGWHVGDPFGFGMVSEKGVPWSIRDYYQSYVNQGGVIRQEDLQAIFQLQQLGSGVGNYASSLPVVIRYKGSSSPLMTYAKQADHANQLPLVSINGLFYAHYLKTFADWSNSWWPTAFRGDGGTAETFNAIYKLALFPTQMFPDLDAYIAYSSVATKVCQGDAKCVAGSIDAVVNAADLTHKSAADQQAFFHDLVETPAHVPPVFQAVVKDGELTYPVLTRDFVFAFRAQTYTRETIAAAFRLPRDIEMTEWHEGYRNSLFAPRRLFSALWAKTGLAFPKGRDMAELIAALSLVHQPVAMGPDYFGVKPGPDGPEWDSRPTQAGGHNLISLGYVVKDKRLGIIMRNSWGYKDEDITAYGLENNPWTAYIPRFLLERFAAIFAKAHAGDCGAMDSDVRAIGAAYLFLRDAKGYVDFSPTGEALLQYMTQCGERAT